MQNCSQRLLEATGFSCESVSLGDNKCRLESVGTMWNCSQKGESATRDDQNKYNIWIKKPKYHYINQLLDRI